MGTDYMSPDDPYNHELVGYNNSFSFQDVSGRDPRLDARYLVFVHLKGEQVVSA